MRPIYRNARTRNPHNSLLERTMSQNLAEFNILLERWKAARDKAYATDKVILGNNYKHRVIGLLAAHEIFTRPPNTRMHMGKEPCPFEHDEWRQLGYNFCGHCGKALSQ